MSIIYSTLQANDSKIASNDAIQLVSKEVTSDPEISDTKTIFEQSIEIYLDIPNPPESDRPRMQDITDLYQEGNGAIH